MKLWRYMAIMVSALLFGVWLGAQINKGRDMKSDMEIAELLIDKERNYFEECHKQLENPDYEPHLGSSTICNFHNGILTVKEQDPRYRFEADHMTIQNLVEGYRRISWILRWNEKYRNIYEKYLLYETEFLNLMEEL